jgi:hypothetical protein
MRIEHYSYNVSIERMPDLAIVNGRVTKSTDIMSGNNMSGTTAIVANPTINAPYDLPFSIVISSESSLESIKMFGVVHRDLGNDNVTIEISKKRP